jgi:amino acid transporter
LRIASATVHNKERRAIFSRISVRPIGECIVLLKLLGIVLAVSALGGLYMVFLALQAGDVSGALLFFGFVLLLGLPAFACLRRWNTACAVDATEENANAPARFVPHWFMMAALILTALAVLAALVIPLVLR